MYEEVLSTLREQFESLSDPRKGGPNTKYKMADAALSAFSVFMMQSPSFLAYQREVEQQQGYNNLESLFGTHEIPSDNQIRNLLDGVNPQEVGPIFWSVYEQLERSGVLTEHRGVANNLLCGVDGTQYFSSTAIQCPNCTQRQRDGQTYYSHTVLIPVLVQPQSKQVYCLEPEFIWPQDGAEKQDCEQNALKRWLERHAHRFAPHTVTLLADDLHCHQPTCAACLEHEFNFIFVCRPDSHGALYEEIGLLEQAGGVAEVTVRHHNGRFYERHHYRYANQVPLRGGAEPLYVNWCEVTILNEKTGERLYFNQFATNHWLQEETIGDVVASGRARWKTENEGNNVLKRYGYHLEHNFGHGQQFLSAVLLSLNLLAFLMHTVLYQTDPVYQQLRHELGAQRTFFQDIRTLTRYMPFDSWQHLLNFMFKQLQLDADPKPT